LRTMQCRIALRCGFGLIVPALQRAAARPASGQISRSQDRLLGGRTKGDYSQSIHPPDPGNHLGILIHQMIQLCNAPLRECRRKLATAELTRPARLTGVLQAWPLLALLALIQHWELLAFLQAFAFWRHSQLSQLEPTARHAQWFACCPCYSWR